MSDAYLYAFGCAVSFIAIAGAYIYLRACFLEKELRQESVYHKQQKKNTVALQHVAS